ncbi:hypothetical protein [Streptomyces chryseus]|uniref:SH3 domain-containing protein n=1 Tax=Streptomyces chryseus TaxID=68186 RepID=A0ABQ3E7X7_9ACTN|nr:hypothetical protein [Streptomyces chryseus]GGX37450.1 hypothetical protein GCM10010353_60970 [Streptomyces chryseus]GHB26053.1 hypothetical protein GCM10010346_57100 [Streptomyces chryseus]
MTSTSPRTGGRRHQGEPGSRIPFRALRSFAGLLVAVVSILVSVAQPAAAHPPSGSVYVWASDVRVRTCQSTTCALATTERLTRVRVQAYCQIDAGERGRVTDGPYTNTYWVQIITPGRTLGWISAVYAGGGSNNSPVPGAPVDSPTDPSIDCEYV